MAEMTDVRETVRERYAVAAKASKAVTVHEHASSAIIRARKPRAA